MTAKTKIFVPGPLTRAHVLNIGLIASWWPHLDSALDYAIAVFLHLPIGKAHLITAPMNFHQKRDLLKVLVEDSILPAGLKLVFKNLMGEIERLQLVRNDAVHSIFTKGQKKGAIRPKRLKAKGKIVRLGHSPDEPEFTAAGIRREAEKIRWCTLDLHSFAILYDRYRDVKKESGPIQTLMRDHLPMIRRNSRMRTPKRGKA
ncbi:MAG TPA: hypothetical protein VKY65_01430 [Alphaproteobacteria bacterium]|nr:hypothetical protein [Alphaproteobacteria bacterium]